MPATINSMLEELWDEIKTILNDNREGMDVHRLESLLQTHSRRIILELGKSNIHALPAGMVENIFNHALPQGIDPLISSLLSYIKVDALNENIFLDPLGKIKNATGKLNRVLRAIANHDEGIVNLAWLQYTHYLEAVADWQEVIQSARNRVTGKFTRSKIHLALKAEMLIQQGPAHRELVNWATYLKEIKRRKEHLSIIHNELNCAEDLGEIFFALSMENWKKLMLFDEKTEAYWQDLRSHPEKISKGTFSSQMNIIPFVQTGKAILTTALNYAGYTNAARVLKTYRQDVIDLIDQRLADYQEAEVSCETLIAIDKAQALFVSQAPVIQAQIQQLDEIEAYLNTVIDRLTSYSSTQQTLDSSQASLLLRIKAWLGFRNSKAELASTRNLAAQKTQSFTHFNHSTRAVLHAVRIAKASPPANWNRQQFETIRENALRFHDTARVESSRLTALFNTHNENFRNEWYFWHRKTILVDLYRNLAAHCPLKPR